MSSPFSATPGVLMSLRQLTTRCRGTVIRSGLLEAGAGWLAGPPCIATERESIDFVSSVHDTVSLVFVCIQTVFLVATCISNPRPTPLDPQMLLSYHGFGTRAVCKNDLDKLGISKSLSFSRPSAVDHQHAKQSHCRHPIQVHDHKHHFPRINQQHVAVVSFPSPEYAVATPFPFDSHPPWP